MHDCLHFGGMRTSHSYSCSILLWFIYLAAEIYIWYTIFLCHFTTYWTLDIDFASTTALIYHVSYTFHAVTMTTLQHTPLQEKSYSVIFLNKIMSWELLLLENFSLHQPWCKQAVIYRLFIGLLNSHVGSTPVLWLQVPVTNLKPEIGYPNWNLLWFLASLLGTAQLWPWLHPSDVLFHSWFINHPVLQCYTAWATDTIIKQINTRIYIVSQNCLSQY